MRRLLPLNRFRVPLLALAFILAAGSAAFGAGPAMTMEELNLSIMPEFDAMNVIVNGTGTFLNDTGGPFQGEIVWTMPKGSEVFMVCETENGMSCQPYKIDTSNPDYDQVIWRPSRAIQPGAKFPMMVEYTMDKITAAKARQFTVAFTPTFPVKTMVVGFKQPKDSSDLVLKPASAQTYQDAEGFTNYYYNYSQLKPFEKLSFDISYTRDKTRPSKEPAQGSGGSGGAGQPGDRLLAVLLAVIGVTLGAVLFYALRGGRGQRPSPGRGNPGRNTARAAHSREAASDKRNASPKTAREKEERKRIRKLLLDGKISEETYRELLQDLQDEE